MLIGKTSENAWLTGFIWALNPPWLFNSSNISKSLFLLRRNLTLKSLSISKNGSPV